MNLTIFPTKTFHYFLKKAHLPYNSFGNGSAMRISPVGWAYNTVEEILSHAKKSAEVTQKYVDKNFVEPKEVGVDSLANL